MSSFNPQNIDAIIFDYGNTLVPFSHDTVANMNAAIERVLLEHFGQVDRTALDAVRARDRMLPYENEHRENHLPTITGNMIRSLYQVEPEPHIIETILAARYDSFLDSVLPSDGVADLLTDWKKQYKLALLSNYPDGDVVRESARQVGVFDFFDAELVSGDIGWAKPHRAMYDTIVERLGVPAERCLMVGDNWLADIQGSKRAGMFAAHITQYETVEHFEPGPEDSPADMTIATLAELNDYLQR